MIDSKDINWKKFNLDKEISSYIKEYSKSYDLIMSLGESCFSSLALRNNNLQNRSYPYDWSGAINWKGEVWPEAGKYRGLERKIELLVNDCKDILNIKDLREFDADPRLLEYPFRWVRNIKTGLQYIHDFPVDKYIKDVFPEIFLKYKRRIIRMYDHFNRREDILLTFFSRDIEVDDAIEQTKLVEKKFTKPNIYWLFCLNDDILNERDVFVYSKKNVIFVKYREKNNFGLLNKTVIERILKPFYLKQK